MTEAIYLQDSYCRKFEALVTAQDAARHAIQLDQTAFYPGGGGQPCDHGWLDVGGQSFAVRRVQRGHWHELEEVVALPKPGDPVQGEIDWQRRYALMRTHTAMHILCGVIWRDYAASVTGGNMQPLAARMDFEFERMRKELVAEIEEKINAEVAAEREVRTQTLPREVAFAIPDLIRTKINLLPEGIQQVRTVELVGLDLQADGGTHVANTREVGRLRISDYKSKGGINKRLYLSLEETRPDAPL
ncbi:MAG: alanyl-tRNA editing protein [Anaerolineaceae bacterium]|nr:alanyl-tRNA editing protein [Anaerolineaceae bacterium]